MGKPNKICLTNINRQIIATRKTVGQYKAEQLLLDLGFHQVRVRIHGSMARIEILPEEFAKLIDDSVRNQITSSFRSLGFTCVTMDLMGYRTGSMNEVLDK